MPPAVIAHALAPFSAAAAILYPPPTHAAQVMTKTMREEGKEAQLMTMTRMKRLLGLCIPRIS
jgi:hypothetical protein